MVNAPLRSMPNVLKGIRQAEGRVRWREAGSEWVWPLRAGMVKPKIL
jgi:hypothetical protein